MSGQKAAGIAVAALALAACSGCAGLSITLPGDSEAVVVEVWNDTDFEVEARIYYDDDTRFWKRLVSPASQLDTGTLLPGEFPQPFNIACDRVGVIYSESAGQFLPGDDVPIGQESSRILTRAADFRCGDTIRFRFVGEGASFGILVYVNGRIVD